MTGRVFAVGVVLAATLAGGPAVAHTGGSNGYASIAVDRDGVRYSLTLWPAALPASVARTMERARAGDARSREELLEVVRTKVTVAAQGRPCQAGPGTMPPPSPSAESLTLVVSFACGGAVRDLVIRDDLFDAFGSDYHTLARIDVPGRTTQFAFAPETREARVAVDAGGRGTASFVLLGIEHILTGWDHLLFLLGLLLRGGGWLSLARIITAFTLAHSVTLALAVLDVVVLPDRLVEAVIALSIALVAAENLVPSPVVARRWLVSFAFGLVHGFGFSSALRELGLPTHGLLLSLFGFNLGVELGQALVVAVALPALVLVRRTRWERRMIWSSSLAILLVGIVLFVERTFF
jgi:HupE/UreJ protein